MSELNIVLQEIIPLAKTFLPVVLVLGFFHCFLKISFRILSGDACFYISSKHSEKKSEEKSEEKSENFDIPEKQTDFIQLN